MSDRMNIYIDGAEEYDIMVGGEVFEFVVDRLIRHKFTDEKPKNLTWVLIRHKGCFGNVHNSVSWYVEDEGFYVAGFDEPFDGVTHWWELPKVGE